MNKKIIIGALLLIGICGGAYYFKDLWMSVDGIVDFNYDRDKDQVEQLFKDDWVTMLTDESVKTFSVDFMLKNKTSSQSDKRNNLVLKVWREDGDVVAFLAYYKKSLYHWQLLFLIVNKDYRGQGRSKKMVQYGLDDMVARGAVRVELNTRTTNKPARSLYSKHFGFKKISGDETYTQYAWYKK
jgi:ribosomal protein S18 acetylase RimI-like enzyme